MRNEVRKLYERVRRLFGPSRHANTMPATLNLTLEERRRLIYASMDLAKAATALGAVKHAGFQRLLARLKELGVEIGADTGLSPDEAHRLGRLALTIVMPNQKPLICLNLIRLGDHDEAELVDTIAHEAIHAIANLMGRCAELPDIVKEPVEYDAEEIVALAGANYLLRRIEYPAARQIRNNKRMIRDHESNLHRNRFVKRQIDHKKAEGKAAAQFLLEHS